MFLWRRSLKTFSVGRGGVEEEINFFLNFLCTFETHGCIEFFLESFVELL